jgi:uncharacterized membrane protein YjdF
MLQPGALVALVVWNFAVLSAAQLTIRLIMAYSVRLTLLAAVVLSLAALPVAAMYDRIVAPEASLATRLAWAPLAMFLNGLAGFAIARWVLRIRRLRGQVAAALMIGLLDPHLFTLLFP